MTFSENQVRQLYVASAVKSSVAATDTAGTIAVKSDAAKTHLYFQYKGADNLMRSDLFDPKTILDAKVTPASALTQTMKVKTLALDPTINGGNPVAGQDYVLRISFRQYLGMSDEDQYFKYGLVHAYSGMTPEQFYNVLLTSLIKNFSREAAQLLSFSLAGVKASATMSTNSGVTATATSAGTAGNALTISIASVSAGAAAVTVTNGAIAISLTSAAHTIADLKAAIAASPAASALVTISGTDATSVSVEATPVALTGGSTTGIVMTEVPQEWVRGIKEQVPVYFEVYPTTILVDGDERIWGTVTASTGVSLGNGKKIADLEYFLMGERGDQYRNINWPNSIPTVYLVDPNSEYHIFDINYAYTGSNEGVQKSQKTISIVCADKTAMNSIITAFNTATGLSVATLA